jgi:hypothetical protein
MTPFFFSYAHNDALDGTDGHLHKFYKELNELVRGLTGKSEDGFLDEKRLKAGDEWSKELADALCEAPVMVSVYSPSYFASTVCGQELQVFLERRSKYMEKNPGRRPSNIVPVLWQPCETIPRALPGFQYEKPRARGLENEGVSRVSRTRKAKELEAIIHAVAVRVKEAYKSPLPKLDYKPLLTGLPSAFEPPPLPPAEFDKDSNVAGPQCATFVYARTPEWKEWPFTPESDPLLRISAAVAKGRDLQLRQLSFDAAPGALWPRLNAARLNNNLVVFLVTGTHLKDPALVERIRECDQQGIDALSALVVWPPGTRGSEAQKLVKDAFPKLSERQPPYFYSDLDHPDKFADAVAKSLDALGNVVLKNPLGVQELAGKTEYSALPSVRAA